MIGLTIGVMILTVVVSVMNGFDRELKTRLLDAVPHITVTSQALPKQNMNEQEAVVGPVSVTQVNHLISQLTSSELREIETVGPFYKGFGALSNTDRVYPIGLYGIEPQAAQGLNVLRTSQYEGDLSKLPANGIAISMPVARMLDVSIGDTLMVMGVQSSGDSVRPKMYRYVVGSIFQLGAETDYSLALVNLDRFTPAQWSALGEYGVQIQLNEPLRAPSLAQSLKSVDISNSGQAFRIASWNDEFGELFQAVQLEKSMMFLLLLLVVAIAAFNIIAGQSMVVSDKRADIGILRTMGASTRMLQLAFLTQGIWVSLCGTLVGLGLGVAVAGFINEILDVVDGLTGMHLLDGSLFVRVPVRFLPTDLLLISCMSAGLCLLSAWIPARRAAQLDPVANLH